MLPMFLIPYYFATLLCLVSVSYSEIDHLFHEFEELRNDMPKDMLSDFLDHQEFVLRTIAFADDVIGKFNDTTLQKDTGQRRAPFYSHNSLLTHDVQVPVKVNIVMIGMPAEVSDVMEKWWLPNLNRPDSLKLFRYKDNGISKENIEADVSYEFHLIRTSFHVSRVFEEFIALNSRSNSETTGSFYISTFEMDSMLEEFGSVIYNDIHDKDDTPVALTLFVLNVPHQGSIKRLGYSDTYSVEDISLLARNSSIMQASASILRSVKTNSKIELDATGPKLDKPLNVADYNNAAATDADADATTSNKMEMIMNRKSHIHIRDAVKSSRNWAISKLEKLDKLVSIN